MGSRIIQSRKYRESSMQYSPLVEWVSNQMQFILISLRDHTIKILEFNENSKKRKIERLRIPQYIEMFSQAIELILGSTFCYSRNPNNYSYFHMTFL